MTDLARELLKGCGGVLVCMVVWLAAQAIIRRGRGAAPDADVLDEMTHGCGACGHSHGCGGSGTAGQCGGKEFTVLGRQS